MKITVYTIKDCAFSKQEKEYLNTNKLVFEEKDLETNKDFLTEMLAISNNFAGTPVTRVEKDDGTISVLKGFTKEEFDTTFGFASPAVASAEAGSIVPPVNDTPIPPASPAEVLTKEGPDPVPTPIETPASPAVGLPEAGPTVSNDPLKSVMDDLQAKVDESLPSVTPVEQPSVVPPTDAPTIPDFPTK